MADNKKARPVGEPSSFEAFVRKHVAPLSRLFAESPLMELKVKTAEGSVTLVKSRSAASVEAAVATRPAVIEAVKPVQRAAPAARVYNGEAGRAYATINAEVVGLFRDISEPPTTGDKLAAGRILGYIEALRLRNEVRCPVECTLIAQVVVDGQPVDFGEALFVVDSGGAALPGAAGMPEAVEASEAVEPPRI